MARTKNTARGGGRGKTPATFPARGGGGRGGGGRGRGRGRAGRLRPNGENEDDPQREEERERPDPNLRPELITGRKKRRRKLVGPEIRRLQKSTNLLIPKFHMVR